MCGWESNLTYEWEADYSHNGRSLRSPTWLGFMPPLPEDERDLFDANPDYGHEKIERDSLRKAGVPEDEITGIYFGNWQRDFSQLIVPMFAKVFGERSGFVCNLIFEVVDVVAEAKFSKRLDRNRFGIYRWEEHIDNPREYGIALNPSTCSVIPADQRRPEDEPEAAQLRLNLWREGRGAIQNYILASQNYVLRQLGLAMQYGRDDPQRRGLEHLGNALHTIEDFYAHSNFIELCLTTATGRGDPMTGRWASNGQPVRDNMGRYRLTTGVFLLGDTLVSLQKLLLSRYEGRPPGSEPSNMGGKITRVLIRRLLGDGALRVYDGLMRALEATGFPAIKREIEEQIGRVLYPLRAAIAQMLTPLVDAAARQTGNRPFPMPDSNDRIIEISHSRLAKDSQHHPYNIVCRSLAVEAVRGFWDEINNLWTDGVRPQIDGVRLQMPNLVGRRFRQLLDRYMNHPQAVGDWWVPLVRILLPTRGVTTSNVTPSGVTTYGVTPSTPRVPPPRPVTARAPVPPRPAPARAQAPPPRPGGATPPARPRPARVPVARRPVARPGGGRPVRAGARNPR